jgi:hypothetical protein
MPRDGPFVTLRRVCRNFARIEDDDGEVLESYAA